MGGTFREKKVLEVGGGGRERDGEMYFQVVWHSELRFLEEAPLKNWHEQLWSSEKAPLKNWHGQLWSSEVAPLKIGKDNFGPGR